MLCLNLILVYRCRAGGFPLFPKKRENPMGPHGINGMFMGHQWHVQEHGSFQWHVIDYFIFLSAASYFALVEAQVVQSKFGPASSLYTALTDPGSMVIPLYLHTSCIVNCSRVQFFWFR